MYVPRQLFSHSEAIEIGPLGGRTLKPDRQQKLSAACDVINDAARMLESASTIVLLADSHGVIIGQYGDESALNRAREVRLSAGFDWSESSMGLNGLGSALSVGGPVRVHGEEHSCPYVRQWTCSGTLLSDPEDGNMLGALCIASLDHGFAPFSIPLVVSMASQVQLGMLRAATRSAVLDSGSIGHIARERPRLVDKPRPNRSAGLDAEQLAMIDAFIESHLNRRLDLQHLADVVGMSRFHFHRCFKLSTGETPHAHVSRRRLARACGLLATSSLSLTDISASAGFSDQSHFTMAFRNAMGMTPGFYRHMQQGGGGPTPGSTSNLPSDRTSHDTSDSTSDSAATDA